MQENAGEYLVRRVKGVGRHYQIQDHRRSVLYNVREKKFSIGKKMLITDPTGNELGYIRRGFSLILPGYRITLNGAEAKVITVTRKFSLQVGYTISGLPWSVECDYVGGVSRVTGDTGEPVMEMERAMNSWTDRYYLSVERSGDLLSCACIAIAMDAAAEDLMKARQS